MRNKKKADARDGASLEELHREKPRRLEIILTSIFFSLLMIALIVNLAVYMKRDSATAINNNYNSSRQEIIARQNIRGRILSADGDVLAETKEENGKEIRVYPYQNLFAHVVGYAVKGKAGIENTESMNLLLSHESLGNKVQNELASVKNYGDDVYTTLDVDLQQAAYDALGVYNGAIIVSQPQTGRILAMVSKPDFDPNTIMNIWDDIVADNSSSVLLNRATQGLYPPGSTFKIVTALEYYRENGGNVSDYSFNCNGKFNYEGSTIRCFHGSAHGREDFTKSFAKSCNSSFANIGTSLELGSFQNTCSELLFGQPIDTAIAYKQSQFNLSESDSTDMLLQTAIGQGGTVITPLLLNMITCAVANGGECMSPYVVDRIQSRSGGVVKQNEPQKAADMMTPQEAEFLQGLMEAVVTEGTGTKLKNDLYTAAGKTGSAEFSSDKSDSHAWFTGYAPATDPQICVTIVVESAGSGGEYAAPIARRLMDEFFTKNVSF